MFVFVKGTEGISNKTGKPYQVLTLAEYVKVGEKVRVKLDDFFPNNFANLEDFEFGDIVTCDFHDPDFRGDYPKLISVTLAYQSPYVELIGKYEKA